MCVHKQEMHRVKAVNVKLRHDLAKFVVPDIMYYIDVRKRVTELRKEHKMWRQKVDIARKTLHDETAAWERVQHLAAQE